MAQPRDLSAFAIALLDALTAKKLNQTEFGALTGHPRAFINQLLHSTRTPPLDEVDGWADKLGLTGRAKVRFVNLAALAHLPDSVAQRFITIIDEHDRLLADYQNLAATVKRAASPRKDYKP